jgi:hypothetical protein
MDILNSSTSDIHALLSKLPPQASLRLDINANISITSDETAYLLKDVDVIQLVSYPSFNIPFPYRMSPRRRSKHGGYKGYLLTIPLSGLDQS